MAAAVKKQGREKALKREKNSIEHRAVNHLPITILRDDLSPTEATLPGQSVELRVDRCPVPPQFFESLLHRNGGRRLRGRAL